jgi:hypothetical protein
MSGFSLHVRIFLRPAVVSENSPMSQSLSGPFETSRFSNAAVEAFDSMLKVNFTLRHIDRGYVQDDVIQAELRRRYRAGTACALHWCQILHISFLPL